MNRDTPRTCWCGGELAAFSDAYARCAACGTLVSTAPAADLERVAAGEQGFYGRRYWFEHQQEAYGQPTITERSRSDLPERCLHWLKHLLSWRLPPAHTVELGCAHGGFVRMLRDVGFDAEGQEMSPWVARYASETFGVDLYTGPLAEQDLAENTFDTILHFDVLEHFREPAEELALHARLLKPSGLLLFQTPCYRDEGPSWSQCKHTEHLHLFTERSVRLLLSRERFQHVRTDGGLFPYDMTVVASRQPLVETPIGKWLRQGGQMPNKMLRAGALLAALLSLEGRLTASDADREARLKVIEEQKAFIEHQKSLLDPNSLAALARAAAGRILGKVRRR